MTEYSWQAEAELAREQLHHQQLMFNKFFKELKRQVEMINSPVYRSFYLVNFIADDLSNLINEYEDLFEMKP